MKRMTVLLLEAILRLCLAACGKVPESKQSLQEPHTEVTDTAGTEEKQHNSELIGPWHLDSKKMILPHSPVLWICSPVLANGVPVWRSEATDK